MGSRPDWTIGRSSRPYGHGPLSLPPLRRRGRLRRAVTCHLVQRVWPAPQHVRPPPPPARHHRRACRVPGGSASGACVAKPSSEVAAASCRVRAACSTTGRQGRRSLSPHASRGGTVAFRAAPALAVTTSPIATISRPTRSSPSTMKPAVAAAAGSRLISTPKTLCGQPPERLELERVGNRGRQDRHGQPDRDHLRAQQTASRVGEPYRRDHHGADRHAERQALVAGDAAADLDGEQYVGRPEAAREQRQRHAEAVEVRAAEVRQQQDARRRPGRPTGGRAAAWSPRSPRRAVRRTRSSPRPRAGCGRATRRRTGSSPPARTRRRRPGATPRSIGPPASGARARPG